MDEIIKEIKQAEEEGKARITAAELKAASIAADLEVELSAIKSEYEQKLKDGSEAVLESTRKAISDLKNAEAKESSAKAEKIYAVSREKVRPCADKVYDFIIKEFTK